MSAMVRVGSKRYSLEDAVHASNASDANAHAHACRGQGLLFPAFPGHARGMSPMSRCVGALEPHYRCEHWWKRQKAHREQEMPPQCELEESVFGLMCDWYDMTPLLENHA